LGGDGVAGLGVGAAVAVGAVGEGGFGVVGGGGVVLCTAEIKALLLK